MSARPTLSLRTSTNSSSASPYLDVATQTTTTVGVTRLAGPDCMIGIEAVPAAAS
jgi:hypothetical protein